jgi:hypothetical protein
MTNKRRIAQQGKAGPRLPGGKARDGSAPQVNCQTATRLIADYLSKHLGRSVCEAFEKHLSHCQDCTALLNTYKKTIEITRSFFTTQSIQHPAPPLPLARLGKDGLSH